MALIAEKHFAAVRLACKEGAPNHLFVGERTQLRTIPDTVLSVMGKYVDVFCTQSLIRLPRDPPEWKSFQSEHYDHEFGLVQKPMVIIDWAAPFTLSDEPELTEYGKLELEEVAGRDAAAFVESAFKSRYMIGLFICQVIGSHPNDSFFTHAKRTYLRDDGTPYATRKQALKQANVSTLDGLYSEVILAR